MDKPICHHNIVFEDLLIQGYDSNRLIVAIPFICKVMEQCAKSNVFKLPNPWLMVVLHLMVELYQVAELKLNLKFEIKVLFKGLNVELKDVPPTPTTILHNQPSAKLLQQQQQQQHQQQQSLGQLHHLNQQQQHQAAVQMQLQQQHQHQQQLSHQPATSIAQGLERLSIAGRYGAAANGRMAPQSPLTGLYTRLLRLLEPLHISMIANTCTLLLANGFTKQNLPEQAIMVIMQENLNLACSIIKKAAMDKAVPKLCVYDGFSRHMSPGADADRDTPASVHDLHTTKSSLDPTYMHALLAISNTLNTLQPSFFPCFSFSWMLLVSHHLEESFDEEELINEGCATPQQATDLKEDKSIEDVSTPTSTSSAFDTQAPML
ncbi:hypothetical protein NDA13_003192 [Ustilago tritici]|nr:hypothetical protein NDA13_003192 [Ustilago tritici]